MQEIAVVIALLAALCYGGWRIYRVFRSPEDPCYGCAGCPLKAQKQAQTVPWMSGLVYGLQNRPRRFESARHLQKKAKG